MRVICYGDSNTYGYDPRSYFGSRYPADSRWVDLLSAKSGWEVHNNGMNGREIPRREIVLLKSTDLLIIMLGTNDLLQHTSVDMIVERMEHFLNQLPLEKDKILLVAPPPMQSGEWVTDKSLLAASEKIGVHYHTLAQRLGVRFADAGTWNVTLAFDGVHFTEEGHRAFAAGLYEYLTHK